MRKLLFLAHRIPYPPDKGDKIRSFHVLQHLAKSFEVHLGCFFDDPADKAHIETLRAWCATVFCLPVSPAVKAFRAARALVRGRSISGEICRDRRMATWVKKTLEDKEINDVFVFCSAMAPYLSDNASGRCVVFDFVDVDSQKWSAYASSSGLYLRWLYRLEQRRVLALECSAASAGDRVLLSSETEAELFRSVVPRSASRVTTLENGVDCRRFDPGKPFANPFGSAGSVIVFTGAMNYRANIDAVSWFAEAIFPLIRRECSAAEFWIVGSRPTRKVRELSRYPGVHVTGTVEDVRPYLSHAACAVAPLRVARGIQNKVIEAMAMAKPTVVTPAAIQGVSAEPDRDVLVAYQADDFARRIVEVLSGKWRSLGPAARTCVKRHHDWPAKLGVLDEIYSRGIQWGIEKSEGKPRFEGVAGQ